MSRFIVSLVVVSFPGLSASAQELTRKEKEEGFVSLFNGKDLTGWELAEEKPAKSEEPHPSYRVEDGVLITSKDGFGVLFTAKEYKNFVLRFDFMLAEGTNNGIGIRIPRAAKSRSAYLEGLEIDVFDDFALKKTAATRHGQIFGLQEPIPKHNALNPAGAWNTQEIRVKGRNISVYVNDKLILAADLDLLATRRPEHKGLLRESGRIGLLANRGPVKFRNLRIKEL